jgi:hypothetical protein
MAIKADMKYEGKVTSGSYLSYSANGNLAFHICLECMDGNTSFTLWLTDKNKAKAIKTLEMLGADTSKLGSQNYIDYELANVITGKEVSFGTREETYQDKTSIKVSWIGKKTDPNLSRGAATFFGGSSAGEQLCKEQSNFIEDNDIPF